MMGRALALALLLGALPCAVVRAQLSVPVADDKAFEAQRSERGREFRSRASKTAEELEGQLFGSTKVEKTGHAALKSKCPVNADLMWTKESAASIYSTPVLTDMFSDGKKEIAIATFVRYVDALEAEDGDHVPGWPFSLNYAHFHASPLLWDADDDGVSELLLVTFNGEVLLVDETGMPRYRHTLKVPPLRVQRKWYSGLDEKKIGMTRRRLAVELEEAPTTVQATSVLRRRLGAASKPAAHSEHPLDDDEEEDDGDDDDDAPKPPPSPAAKARVRGPGMLTGTAEYYASWDVFGAPSFDRDEFKKKHADPIATHAEGMVGEVTFSDGEHHVLVDAHILSTPVLADVNGDGLMELVCSVSYYYDKQYYADNDVESPTKEKIDMSKYVGGGVVAITLSGDEQSVEGNAFRQRHREGTSLAHRDLLWEVHLDLTTELTVNQATIYAPPVVVDLDRDGQLDVIIGTGMGFIYVLSGVDGKLKPGFPVEMGPIQAGIATADVDGDGDLDIVACDTVGNVAAFTAKGKELWDTKLTGSVSHAPTIVDLDGDGLLEIVAGTASGDIVALRGKDGKYMPNFPVRTGDRIISPVALLPQAKPRAGTEPHALWPRLVVPSFDGRVYLVQSDSGCVDWVDIGEQSYTMVLTDDVDNNGMLDLVVSTMNGNSFVLQTETPYHPLMAWTEQNQCSRNGATYRAGYQGIYVLEGSRAMRDVLGSSLTIQFEIVDKRPWPSPFKTERKYVVRVRRGSGDLGQRRTALPEFAADFTLPHSPNVLFEQTYTAPGIYTARLQAPSTRTFATLTVSMSNEHAQLFCDSFTVGFNIHFYRTLKWELVLPFVAMCAVVLGSGSLLKSKLILQL